MHSMAVICRPHAEVGPRSRSAMRVTVSAFGAVVAFAGLEHGVGEMLQGPAAPQSWVIESWASVEAFDVLAGEPAMTIAPNLLLAGVLTIAVSLAFAAWAIWFVGRPHGGPVLIGLAVALLLVGGGFSPPAIGVVLGVGAMRIGAGTSRPPGRVGIVLAAPWPWFVVIGVAAYLALFPGLVLINPWIVVPDALVYGLAGTAVGATVLALIAARLADRLVTSNAPPAPTEREAMAAYDLADGRWSGLLRAGGVAALLIAILVIGEIAVYAALPRSETAAEHLLLLSENWLAGLLTLDLLGVFAYLLFIPTILALYAALHRSSEGLMLVAAVLFFVGIADFLATNTALPALALARDYASATAEVDRTAILGAGRAMFALFNENAFLSSYVIVSVAWGLVGLAMLRSTIFGRPAAAIGILTGAAGVVAVMLERISEALVNVAIPVYFVAIVLLLAWMALLAHRLWQLGREGDRDAQASLRAQTEPRTVGLL